MTTPEQLEQFWVMLGACNDAARLAQLPLRVELDDGSTVTGIPSCPATVDDDDPDELNHTGVSTRLVLGEITVDLRRVRSYAVQAPERQL